MESITEKAYNESKTINNAPEYINTTDDSKNPTLTSIADLASVVAGLLGIKVVKFRLERNNDSYEFECRYSSLLCIFNTSNTNVALFDVTSSDVLILHASNKWSKTESQGQFYIERTGENTTKDKIRVTNNGNQAATFTAISFGRV